MRLHRLGRVARGTIVPLISTPMPLLPEIKLPEPATVPPIVVSLEFTTSTPSPRLPTSLNPWGRCR